MSDRAGPEAIIGRGVAEATEQLAAALGGASLCSVSRSAGSVPAAKYLEGRISALRELGRDLGTDPPVDAAVERATEVLATWRAELERVREGRHGRDWVAYRAGGVDAIEALLVDLAA